MPRNRKGGSLASYYYGSVGDEIADASGVKPKSSSFLVPEGKKFLSEYDSYGNWVGPGPEPPRSHQPPAPGRKSKPRRKKVKSGPPPAAQHTGPSHKEIKEHMMSSLEAMKKHYLTTEEIVERNTSWPLQEPYTTIEAYILKCKGAIHDARTHKGQGRHRKNVEAVHATRIDTSNWDFASIYEPIVNFQHMAHPNHLKLSKPHHHKDGTHLFVNAVMAWLFAAKSQLMANLAAYIEDQGRKTADMEKFLHHSKQGREALAAFHAFKHKLPPRKSKGYTLQDSTILDEQHKALYG